MLPRVPRAWSNQPIILYHGTLASSVPSILAGVDLAFCQPLKDFGRGFYVTTHRRQAVNWAKLRVTRSGGRSAPAVVTFTVDLDSLSQFQTLSFARSDYEADDYWSLVEDCRQRDVDHARAVNAGWYDVVVGPAALAWEQRQASPDYDQFGFHTPAATALLDKSTPTLSHLP